MERTGWPAEAFDGALETVDRGRGPLAPARAAVGEELPTSVAG